MTTALKGIDILTTTTFVGNISLVGELVTEAVEDFDGDPKWIPDLTILNGNGNVTPLALTVFSSRELDHGLGESPWATLVYL